MLRAVTVNVMTCAILLLVSVGGVGVGGGKGGGGCIFRLSFPGDFQLYSSPPTHKYILHTPHPPLTLSGVSNHTPPSVVGYNTPPSIHHHWGVNVRLGVGILMYPTVSIIILQCTLPLYLHLPLPPSFPIPSLPFPTNPTSPFILPSYPLI